MKRSNRSGDDQLSREAAAGRPAAAAGARFILWFFVPVIAVGVALFWIFASSAFGMFLGGLACLLFAFIALGMRREQQGPTDPSARARTGWQSLSGREKIVIALSVAAPVLAVVGLADSAAVHHTVWSFIAAALALAAADGVLAISLIASQAATSPRSGRSDGLTPGDSS